MTDKIKTYVASSWRNHGYDILMMRLRRDYPQLELYDFKDANSAFHWREIEREVSDSFKYEEWVVYHYLKALETEKAKIAFENDFSALDNAQLVILCNPCGESAHMEAAYATGKGVPVIDYYHYSNSNLNGKSYSLELMKAMFPLHANGYEQLQVALIEAIHQSRKLASYPNPPVERTIQRNAE